MHSDNKPLYSLTISEFKILSKVLIDEALDERDRIKKFLNNEEGNKNEHLTIKQLADFLSCSKQSIHNYKKAGLPYYRIGRKILFEKQKVLKFMKTIKTKRIIIENN
jgi:excisionase family DNA binding protein